MTTSSVRTKESGWKQALRDLGPGLITGAADDDPSGIATYSQAGAHFGYAMLWTVVITTPLMVAIQIVSARIGYVTRRGLMANIRDAYPRWAVVAIAVLLVGANTLNIAADLAAMGEALRLLVGGSSHLYAIAFGVFSLTLQVRLPYQRYVRWLKWLTLALFSYVAVAFAVDLDWRAVFGGVVPRIPSGVSVNEFILMIVALFGTTISPYLFFWQASQEVEEAADQKDRSTADVKRYLRRIKIDTTIGMTFSNAIAFFIMVSTAATLHASGVTTIETSAQAAEALRPIAGDLTFMLFALGIIGTGLLAVPVLAGAAGYAVAEALGWPASLNLQLNGNRKRNGRGFYGVIAAATIGGAIICLTPIDPMRALFGAAVANGVIAVPIMVVMMLLATNRKTMKSHAIGPRLTRLGWGATALMAAVVVAMFVTL